MSVVAASLPDELFSVVTTSDVRPSAVEVIVV